MKKFYLFALVILSFHALAAGDLASAAPPVGPARFLQRQQTNDLREPQQLNQFQREQELNRAKPRRVFFRARGSGTERFITLYSVKAYSASALRGCKKASAAQDQIFYRAVQTLSTHYTKV